jgi:YidC/Oxa1 family membrane protein insertase
MMALFMPIFITIIFLKFPSGIVLYWFIYNIVSVIEQYMIKKSVAEGR